MNTEDHLERSHLLDLLWKCQDEKGYISDEDINEIALALGISMVEVEGVASFFHFFHRRPPGQFVIYLNNSILSEFSGYREVRKAFEEACGLPFGEIDPSGTFGLFDTSCIGLSDQEPAALINFRPFTRLTPEKVRRIVSQLKDGLSVDDLCDEVGDNIRYTPNENRTVLLREYEMGKALEPLRSLRPQEVIRIIKRSGLSGMGGAYFSTGLKWEFCRRNEGDIKYVVCNADEGEPGTFKDRILLNRFPGLMIEGMILGAYAIGARKGYIYLRAEYRWLKHKIEAALAGLREKGWLGEQIPALEPFDFDISIQVGAGSYVCGEETALLESMEGNRGEPRPKLFLPVEKGFLGQPTIVNNVETFAVAARILELGEEFFLSLGTSSSPGTKLLSVSGDCLSPGIYEIEWGITLKELLNLCRATDPYFIQLSGPSGECISVKEKNRRFDRNDLRCGGSVMIFSYERDIFQILCNYAEFFKTESCGVCTPCRAGNFIMSRKLGKLSRGLGDQNDLDELINWGKIMKMGSRCGLGQTAPNALLYAVEKFPEYFDRKTVCVSDGFNKSFELEEAVKAYRAAVKNHK